MTLHRAAPQMFEDTRDILLKYFLFCYLKYLIFLCSNLARVRVIAVYQAAGPQQAPASGDTPCSAAAGGLMLLLLSGWTSAGDQCPGVGWAEAAV